jgi:hypothetical protein
MQEIVDQCMRETGFRSKEARDVCLVAIVVSSDARESRRQFRARIRDTYLRASPEHGSFFIIVVLPILVSIIGHWVAKWIWDRNDARRIRAQAFDALLDSLPSMKATHTSINSMTKTPSTQSK